MCIRDSDSTFITWHLLYLLLLVLDMVLTVSRQGSGSACRSMYGGFVEWTVGSRDDGTDSIAQQIATEHHWPNMHVLILVVLHCIYCLCAFTVNIVLILPLYSSYLHIYYYNHFTTLCKWPLPRWVDTTKLNHSGFFWSRHDRVAVASAEPYASYLHFAPEHNHASTSSVRFLRAGCLFWHPANSIKALKAANLHKPEHYELFAVLSFCFTDAMYTVYCSSAGFL